MTLVLLAACATKPSSEDSSATTEPSPSPAPPRPLQAVSDARRVDVDDLALLRCGYLGRGEERTLDCDVALASFSGEARAELRTLLAAASTDARASTPAAPPLRRYHLAARGPWTVTLVVSEHAGSGRATAELASGRHAVVVAADAPRLLGELRAHSRRRLAASRQPPRPPLPWQAPAHAAFLAGRPFLTGQPSSLAPTPADVELADELAARLVALPPGAAGEPEGTRLATALVASADLFRPARRRELETSSKATLRVLALLPAASDGSRAALAEIFRLADEHGGPLDVFATAARLLFPPGLDPELAMRYPPRPDGAGGPLLLAEIRPRLRTARYDTGARAWRLEFRDSGREARPESRSSE